jgi:hypothetical protein
VRDCEGDEVGGRWRRRSEGGVGKRRKAPKFVIKETQHKNHK